MTIIKFVKNSLLFREKNYINLINIKILIKFNS